MPKFHREIFHVQFYIIIIRKYFIVVDLYIILIQYVDMIKMYLVVEAEALSGRDGIAIKLQAVADKAAGDCEDEVIEASHL